MGFHDVGKTDFFRKFSKGFGGFIGGLLSLSGGSDGIFGCPICRIELGLEVGELFGAIAGIFRGRCEAIFNGTKTLTCFPKSRFGSVEGFALLRRQFANGRSVAVCWVC